MDERVKPNFLPNTPIGDDLFEGKSQEKIADVITEVIVKNDFQVVGIDGAWGTGKSNLVEIIKKKLPNHNFFMYDVWGHQEDEQRKAILVELTEFISCEKRNLVFNKVKWKDKLKKLLAKEKEVTTINRPYLSVGFIFSLFSIIYIPTVNTFAKNDNTIFGVENIIGKLIIILFPIFLILVIYLCKTIYQFYSGSGIKSFKIALQETFQVYNNKQLDETKIETISENEPSVRDFRNWLKEIDSDLNGKKIILVFDNFDRLPKKNILSIWSSIHIFFAEEKYKNIKVIIPFDRLHIKNAFKDLDSAESGTDYANDYINKTFDLVYRVSQPIMSDWKVFFGTKWEAAFGIIEEEEYLKVIQIYEAFREKITPREIIACINEMVSIKLLDETIPDRYIAIFVLNKDEILKSPLRAISASDFLKGLSYLYGGDDDYQKYITALAYQIKPENALEVVYKKQLRDSINNSNQDLFNEISKTSIFDKIVNPVMSELQNLNKFILIFDKLNDNAQISKIHLKNIWNDVYMKVVDSFHDGFDIVDYQKILIKNIEMSKSVFFISSIIDKLLNHNDFEPIKFSRMVDDLNEYLKMENLDIDIFAILRTKECKQIVSSSFLDLVEHKKDKYTDYRVTTDEKKLNEQLSNLELNKMENSNYLKALKKDFSLITFEAKLRTKISQNRSESRSLEIFINALKNIAERPINIELEDHEIYSLYTQTNDKQEFYYDVICLRLVKPVDFSYAGDFMNALDSNDKEVAKKIAERIEFYIDFDDFLINGKYFSDSLLYKNIANYLIVDSYWEHSYTIKDLLINFEEICSSLEIKPNFFIDKLDSFETNELVPNDIIEFPICFYEDLLHEENDFKNKLYELVNSYYEGLNKEKWIIIFSDFESKDFKLLKIIEYTRWNSFSLEAFKTVLIDSIENNTFMNRNIWEYLLNCFIESELSITNTLKDFRDLLYSNAAYTSVEIFKLLFEPFINFSILHDNPKEAFRTFFKTAFLNNDEIVEAMIGKSEEIKALISISESSSSADFKQAIRDKKEDNDSIKLLANQLDIRSSNKSKSV